MSGNKPVIFISYSHKDHSWLDYVRSFFETLSSHGTISTWDDDELRIGDDWKAEIHSALDSCSIFVLLVSRYAVASNFIRDEEVGRILKRPKGEVQFCPIVVTPTPHFDKDWLDRPNRRPPNNKALSELRSPVRDREMTAIAEQIDEILKKTPGPPIAARSPTTLVVADKPATVFPSIVDCTRLAETPYKELVGRDGELRQLDDAWADQKTRIISLVAWGGAGKTSLVIEWLARVRNDGYRNADAVLCWSFFSQGTRQRAASGDEFLDWALGKFKVKLDTTSSTAKGERLAEEMSRRRVLLLLDGLEPLQYGSEGQRGALKDQGLRAFLQALAVRQQAASHSLVVLTSRLAIYDLRKWQDSTAPLIDLGRLSDEAGAALLEDDGVIAPPEALREAAHDFAGHALALSLLAGFLRLRGGRVDDRGSIRAATDDPNDPGHDQARRVIEAYEKEWLATEPVLLAIMYLVGLFDRPASADSLMALRRKPVIDGLTDVLVDLDDDAWRAAIARLREVRLLGPDDPSEPDALDAHPLVREWFGDRLKQINEPAWKAAHGRLYEHLRDTTEEGKTPTLDDLGPLYQAISHGCRAGRHEEALDKIYVGRICRRGPDGATEFYAVNNLGAYGSDLVAISWFFDRPYDAPVATLPETYRSWLLGEAGRFLGSQGRFAEALAALRASLAMSEAAKDWYGAAVGASNLGMTELLDGKVTAAVATAERSMVFAEQSGDAGRIMINRVKYACAALAAGRHEEAEGLLMDAERRQQEREPAYPLLYSVQGYRYCELLLAQGKHAVARERASQTLEWVRPYNWLLDIALDTLTIGRASLGLALSNIGTEQTSTVTRDEVHAARSRLDEVRNRLRATAAFDYIPLGLLTRVALHRNVGDWEGATHELEDVEEIAELGPMKLYLCDLALERARLAFARIAAFAPLNEFIDNGPPKPVAPDAAEAARLKEEAAKQLGIAADYIKTCGYHRRDEELAELQAVLRGDKKFADLPPRV